jgi:hypothetical protein
MYVFAGSVYVLRAVVPEWQMQKNCATWFSRNP